MATKQANSLAAPRHAAWRERFGWCLAPLAIAGLLVSVSVLVRRLGLAPNYAAPSPTGMIARFELPPAGFLSGPDVVVHDHDPLVIEVRLDPAWDLFFTVADGAIAESELNPVEVLQFDFDGDGTADRIETDVGSGNSVSRVRVVSGATRGVLLDVSDPAEYATPFRAFELPDLDGDGTSELALYHPRIDHPLDFMDLGDTWIDVKSWLTVASYVGP